MKRILPLSLAALLSVALFSSCAYDPLSEGYGTAYSSTSYHGGYYDGVYSDFYVGFSNNHYRYPPHALLALQSLSLPRRPLHQLPCLLPQLFQPASRS